MIGHTFDDANALTVAIAPSPRLGDYLVITVTDTDYVVATLAINNIIDTHGKPDHWLEGAYFRSLDEAIENFATRTGLLVDQIAPQVHYAYRQATARSAGDRRDHV